MGVPAFFKWLCARNPQFIRDALENYEEFDIESNNPEIDNLYLDMNGIIHPCCRSDGSVVPIAHSLQDMFNNIFLYIDKLVDLCRPKRVLYMAIDGVAPRAKMNQQRARRFKGAKEAVDLQTRKEELLREFSERSEINDDILSFVQNRFDSNVITPGTQFMRDLSKALQHYVVDRMNSHPLFQNLQVIFSDAGMPGEGEHKILDFIRVQRNQQGYDPNTKHCLYGADADLIMLGLSTHEPYFYIIREQIISADEKKCSICNENGHFQMECPQNTDGQRVSKTVEAASEQKVRKGILQTFQYAKLYVMRQYLEMRFQKIFVNEITKKNSKLVFDIEKIIDDFVFMCFFVGNDFLPHIPNLNIRDGGIDALLTLYEHTLTQVDDYLTNNGNLNLKSVSKYIENMAVVEEELMKVRKDKEERDKKFQEINKDKEAKLQLMKPNLSPEEYQRKRKEWRMRDEKKTEAPEKETLLMRFKRVLDERQKESKTIKEVHESSQVTLNYNYKLSYYNDKFGVKPKDFVQMQMLIKQSYVEALCWNFAYYYKGCISWGWYYPFHYSPFASDLLDIDQHIVHFDLGEPFKPFYQLLAVFPSASALSVPECFRPLMINPDSEISDFYPTDFYVDLIGKRYEWLGEVILPFIEEDRLLNAARKYEHLLSAEERQRNSVSNVLIFMNETAKQIPEEHVDQEHNNLTGTFTSQTPRYPLKAPIPLLDACLNIKRVSYNNVVCKPIQFPTFTRHDIYLLNGHNSPDMEIDERYIEKSDLRTYQGEFTIKLIQKILRGQHNTGQWQKIQNDVISYNSGAGAYGNSLNFREMKKHQDEIEKYSSGYQGNNNNNHNNNYNRNYEGGQQQHYRNNSNNYHRGGAQQGQGSRYHQQQDQQQQQQYHDPNNMFSGLEEPTHQQQHRYNRPHYENRNFNNQQQQYGGGYHNNNNNNRGGYHNNGGRYNSSNARYDDANNGNQQQQQQQQQQYQGGRGYSSNRGGYQHQQPRNHHYAGKQQDFEDRTQQQQSQQQQPHQPRRGYQQPEYQATGYTAAPPAVPPHVPVQAPVTGVAHREAYDPNRAAHYGQQSSHGARMPEQSAAGRQERDEEDMEYDPMEAMRGQNPK